MKKTTLLLSLFLLCACSAYTQNVENLILSNFEKEFYKDSEGTLLTYKLIDAHQLGVSGSFLQVFEVEAVNIAKPELSKKALAISHSIRREFLGMHNFIDVDEVDKLINALEYYVQNLADSKPKNHQSFFWTSRGGYQIQAAYSMSLPRRYNLSSKINVFDSISTSGELLYNKQIEKLIITLKGAKAML